MSAGRSNLVDVECTVVAFTPRAVKVDHGGEPQCWLPLSQCQLDPENASVGDEVIVTLPESLAIEKGMV